MDERRRFRRYPPSGKAYIIGLKKPGWLVEISERGLGATYSGEEELPEELTIGLMLASENAIVEEIRCRKVSDTTVGHRTVYSYVAHRRVGLQFVDPGPVLQEKLKPFFGDPS